MTEERYTSRVDPAYSRLCRTVSAALDESREVGGDSMDHSVWVVQALLAACGDSADPQGWLIVNGRAHDVLEVNSNGEDDDVVFWDVFTVGKD